MNSSPFRRTALALLAASLALPATAKDLRVLVSGIDSDLGDISCLLFVDDKGFPFEQERALATAHYAAAQPMMTCTFSEVEPGRYAVSVMHDANGNRAIDKGFTGSYKESWGVTNNVRPARRAPKFFEAVIYVSATQPSDYEVVLKR